MDFAEVISESDVGRVRKGNEDVVYAGPRLLVVADGMGGHKKGEVAAQIAVDHIVAQADRLHTAASVGGQAILDSLHEVIQEAGNAIEAEGRGNRMGTTVVVAVLSPDGQTVWVGHVGDSRAYLKRGDEMRRLTVDHNVYQTLLARGRSIERARSHPAARKLMQALGHGFVHPDIAEVALMDGDLLLLCTDGLSDVVPEEQVAALLHGVSSLDGLGPSLVAAAHGRGAPDNVSVVLARAPETEPRTFGATAIEKLARLDLFRELDAAQLANVAPYLERRTFERGEYLAVAGEPGDECLILVSGRAQVSRGDVSLAEVEAGSSVGELALIGPWTRTASVRAIEPVAAWSLSRDAFRELSATKPRIGLSITTALSATVAGRLTDLTDRLVKVQRVVSGSLPL